MQYNPHILSAHTEKFPVPCHLFLFQDCVRMSRGLHRCRTQLSASLNKTRALLSLSQLGACPPPMPAGHKPSSSVWGEHVAAAGCRDGARCICVKDRAGAIGFCVARNSPQSPKITSHWLSFGSSVSVSWWVESATCLKSHLLVWPGRDD